LVLRVTRKRRGEHPPKNRNSATSEEGREWTTEKKKGDPRETNLLKGKLNHAGRRRRRENTRWLQRKKKGFTCSPGAKPKKWARLPRTGARGAYFPMKFG